MSYFLVPCNEKTKKKLKNSISAFSSFATILWKATVVLVTNINSKLLLALASLSQFILLFLEFHVF
jgi:hypothetical protein